MIFTRDQARWIVQGKKTTHWLPVHRASRTRVGAIVPVEVKRELTESETYGFTSQIVTGGVRQIGPSVNEERTRVAILAKTSRRLEDMNLHDARAAGYRTTDEAITDWIGFDRDLHPRRESVLRWIDRAAGALGTTVAVLTFEVDQQEHPRYLTPTGRPDRMGPPVDADHGYTSRKTRALPGEPEAVDAVTQERFAREARERDEARLEAMTVEELEAEARRRGTDVSHHLRVISERKRRAARQIARTDLQDEAA